MNKDNYFSINNGVYYFQMKKFNYKDIFINKHVAISRAISMVENDDSQVAKF